MNRSRKFQITIIYYPMLEGEIDFLKGNEFYLFIELV